MTHKLRYKIGLIFISLYLLATYLITPLIAPIFGREKINNTDIIQPTNYLIVLLNRNYVHPKINELLANAENELQDTGIHINYLDANFPFINKFPLLPHLSHNNGKKIDISLVYEQVDGTISAEQKSRLGYGVFVEAEAGEINQPNICLNAGHSLYNYPKYFSFGLINDDLAFSVTGTKKLITSLLKSQNVEKIFIEPHLQSRMGLADNKIRYHGCHAVRHDDHVHLQVK